MTGGGIELLSQLNNAGRGRVSPARWMRRHYDQFAAMLAEKPADWEALAQGFAAIGIVGDDGAPLAAETIRSSWWRTRKAMGRTAPPLGPPARPPSAQLPATMPDEDPIADIRRQLAHRSGRTA